MDTISIGAWVILATQGVGLISTLVGIVLTALNRKAIYEVHLSLNGRMDQLVASSLAEGKLDGIKTQQARQDQKDGTIGGGQ